MKTQIRISDLKGPSGGIMYGTTEVLAGQYPVTALGYHQGVHFDEVVTDLGLRRNAGKFYPGIKTAKVLFLDRETLEKADVLANLKRGILIVGASDSPYNEHETASRGEVADQCAATLAAGLHGYLLDKKWKHLLEETRWMDRNPKEFEGNVPGHIANIMKAMLESGASDEEVFNWATKGAEAMYFRADNFFEGAMQEFDKVAQAQRLHLFGQHSIRVAIIRADEEVFTNVAWRKQFDAVLALKSDGTMYFGTRKGGPIPLETVMEMFRRLAVWNLRACKQEVPPAYEVPGAKLPDNIGPLHLWREARGILNKEIPVKLSQETVIRIVRDSIGWNPEWKQGGGGRGRHGSHRKEQNTRLSGGQKGKGANVELAKEVQELAPGLDSALRGDVKTRENLELEALARSAAGKRAGTQTPDPATLVSVVSEAVETRE